MFQLKINTLKSQNKCAEHSPFDCLCFHALKSEPEATTLGVTAHPYIAGQSSGWDVPETHPAPSLLGTASVSPGTCQMVGKYRMQKLLQTQVETEKSLAIVRNLYCIAHVVPGSSSFGRSRWCDSNKLYCFLSAFQSWMGRAFRQRIAGDVHYQEH